MKNLVKFSVFSENQWVFPDDKVDGVNEELLKLHIARGGNVLCQILTDISVTEKSPFTMQVNGANGVTVIPYQLVPYTVLLLLRQKDNQQILQNLYIHQNNIFYL